ncbi:MAG: SBBP repeat-containing protein [Flavobacteriales bacterium]|nr:SBBP repeat-containing protein [Flavobacteriales bacterium]
MNTRLLILTLCFPMLVHAQTVHWANGYGGPDSDKGNAVAVDTEDNVLITGSFSDSFELGTSGITLTSAGGTDIFVAKIGPDGILAWAFGIGVGGTYNDEGKGIASDAQGNVYVTGSFKGTDVDFDPGPDTFPMTSVNQEDIFVCKFSPIGELIWAYSFGGSSPDRGNGITVDDTGNVFVVGRVAGTVDFDPGPENHSLITDTYDAFVLSVDTDGNYRWAVNFLGTGADEGHDVALDDAGNVFVSGEYLVDIDLDPGPNTVFVADAGPSTDAFICKLDPNGEYLWSATLASAAGADQVLALAIDDQGNVFGTGEFHGDPLTVATPSDTIDIPYTGETDVFIIKLNNAGPLEWARAIAGPQAQHAYAIAVDQEGYVYTTGYVNSNSVTDFDPGPEVYNIAASNPSLFLSVLNSAGEFECAKITTSSSGWDQGNGIALDGDDNLYLTGYFNNTTDFDLSEEGTAELLTAGTADIFVLKMTSACSIILDIEGITSSTMRISPNPAGEILRVELLDVSGRATLDILDLTGKHVLSQTLKCTTSIVDVTSLQPGIYLIKTDGQPPVRFVKM